ncbi:MAG: 5-oxoprolinase subunit PxpA [Bryobacteraceae bacterium]
MKEPRIFLNADVGERPEALADGSEEALLRLLDWANIACGGHAGDDHSMRQVSALCRSLGVQVGAHPGYPDRERFGREELGLPPEAIAALVFEQVRALGRIAGQVRHVKPHGALYNTAVRDPSVAAAIATGAARWSRDVTLVGLAGSRMIEVWRGQGFVVVEEAFADRRYLPDGTLRPRRFPDALITAPKEAAAQARRLAATAGTLSVHSDTPGALDIARAVREALDRVGTRRRL